VENEGAAPDVDVENWPKDAVAGHDAQLERVVQEGLRMLKEKPVKRLGTRSPRRRPEDSAGSRSHPPGTPSRLRLCTESRGGCFGVLPAAVNSRACQIGVA
jgi:hypothetical protein